MFPTRTNTTSAPGIWTVTATTANERVFVAKIEGAPAGIAVDPQGNVWVAAKGIVIYSPEGKQVRVIEMHEVVSGLAFGEADFKTLFLTARGVVFRARPDTQ